MAIGIILGVLAGLATVAGAGGHINAKEVNEQAQKLSEKAKSMYEAEKASLNEAHKATEAALLKLGYAKINVLNTSMKQFLDSYEKVKNVQFTTPTRMNELPNFALTDHDAIQLRETTAKYSISIKSGAAGAAAGAVVALAASGTLPIIAGMFSTAGSVLLMGEVGAAAGLAGTALSAAATMTPLIAIAAPAILFTGISASRKADENLEEAQTMYAEAEAAVEKMRINETLCNAIASKSDMFLTLLSDLNVLFSKCSSQLAGVIKSKTGILKKGLTSQSFSEDEIKLFFITRALAGAVKAVIDTPILSKGGDITQESTQVYNEASAELPVFKKQIAGISQTAFRAKPIQPKASRSVLRAGSSPSSHTSSLLIVRNVSAFLLACLLATLFAAGIAKAISSDAYKFWFISSYVMNLIAVWLMLFTTIFMLIGKVSEEGFGKVVCVGAAISIFILYVQFCRSVETMRHYIIFSLLLIAAFYTLRYFLTNKAENWCSVQYFSRLLMCFIFCPVFFLLYAFASKTIGFSIGFSLVVSAIFMLIASIGILLDLLDN